MSAKVYLKAAKQALNDENPEYCIELAKDALKIDPKSYIAHLFIGKSYHLLEKPDLAIQSYKKAIEIEPDQITAWRGWFLIVKNSSDYLQFFDFVGKYVEVLINLQQGTADLIKEIQLYLKKYPTAEVREEYLRSLLPENVLGQATHGTIEKPEKVLKEYLEILLERENSEVSRKVTRARMNTKDPLELDAVSWSNYANSNVAHLYEELINVLNDTSERRFYEDQYLRYRVKVLKAAPSNIKPEMFKSIKEMIDGMIVIKHSSLTAWTLYFDWSDFQELSSIEESVLQDFLELFSEEPLGQILHAFVLSDLSTFTFEKEKSKEKAKRSEALSGDEKEIEELDETGDDAHLTQEELLTVIVQSLESCKTSLIAYRIVIASYIHMNNYEPALVQCQNAIQLLAKSTRSTGFPFKNSKEEILVDYGLVLTYHESPKYFKKALGVFESVLKESPSNVKARISKGLILVESQDLEDANTLLAQVVQEFPNDMDALQEYSWCRIRLGEYQQGREGLMRVLKNLKGISSFFIELKAAINWKIAQSYLLQGGEVEKAYEFLVESLRVSQNYAPSYTSLGEIYIKHYNDQKRAIKCFLKAFELDSGEIIAARYLVEDFAESLKWDQAALLCRRILVSENAKRRLKNDCWPYRILGCSALEIQDDAKASEWFQTAIRLDPNDTESWVGLGEAYYQCGRLEAASKVFKKALDLEPDHWIAKYLLGVSYSSIGEFDGCIKIFEELLVLRPKETCVVSALYESLLNYANSCIASGFFGKAIGLALRATEFLHKGNTKSLNFWKSASDIIQIFLLIQSKIEEFPYDTFHHLLKTTSVETDDEFISSFADEKITAELVSLFLIYANKAALSLNPTARPLQSSCWYNLGVAELTAFLKTGKTQYRDSSVDSLKKAIKLQSNYAGPWIALGISSITVNPRVSQHCFIKATTLDPKNVQIWADLALLYLKYDDPMLAIETYRRGESLAPSESISWLGHALSSKALGDNEVASNLFAHAFVLANGRSPAAQLSYAANVCLKRIGHGDDSKNLEAVQEISSACFGMKQYLKHYPSDVFGLTVTCLLLEKLNDYELGLELSSELLLLLEHLYEKTEDELLLTSFGRVKAQTARFELGLGHFDTAIENSQASLELTDDTKTVISARTVLGLSHFFLDNFDAALEEFQQLLTLTDDAKRLVVLIAQVLYIYDTEETRQAALDQLFHNIEIAGSSLLVTLTIGAISVIENLEDYMLIIKSELKTLPLDEVIQDRFRNVPYLLSKINERLSNNDKDDVWQKAAVFFPDDLKIWNNIDKKITLKIAAQGKVNAIELGNAYIESGRMRDIQRGIFLAPWSPEGYIALKACVKTSASVI